MEKQTVSGGKRILGIKEFVNLYGIGRDKTFEEINSGRLKAVVVGKRTLIPVDFAEQWLANLPLRGLQDGIE